MKGIFINNKWRQSRDGETFAVMNPSTGQSLADVAAGSAEDVENAVSSARAAFEGEWGQLAPMERGRLLSRMIDVIERNAEELQQLECEGLGKPASQARGDITAAMRYFEYYGGAADKIHGITIPYANGYQAFAERVPLGVTAHIIPWNYPIQMFARSVAPSLAAGNAVVLKPAEEACLSVLRLAELTAEVGLPDGAISVVSGKGTVAGKALSESRGIDFLSFIGSTQVGKAVQAAAAANAVGCALELGGKSPQILFADADLDKALPVIVNAIIQNSGQTCSAGSRLLVESQIYDEVCERLAEIFSNLRYGPPGSGADLGPIVSLRQRTAMAQACDAAEADGARCIGRGQAHPDASSDGYFFAPRVYGDVEPHHPLAQREIFGPVLSVLRFSTEGEAIAIANGTDYSLVAGIWTGDGKRATRLSRWVHAGQIFLNCYGAGGGIELPFGGGKLSGHGREKGFEALLHLTTVRTVVSAYH